MTQVVFSRVAVPSRDEFRGGMARLAGAVNVITTDGPGGRAGFTASAVCSVSDDPPTLLVCINRGSSVHGAFTINQRLCVNTLSAAQRGLGMLFGGKTPMADRFAAGEWTQSDDGSPALVGAIASFDCEITKVVQMSTHDVMFCTVRAVAINQGGLALVYVDRQFHDIGAVASI